MTTLLLPIKTSFSVHKYPCYSALKNILQALTTLFLCTRIIIISSNIIIIGALTSCSGC